MKISIAEQIFEKYPNTKLGVLIVRNCDNSKENPEILQMINEQCEKIRSEFTTDSLRENTTIQAWRDVYRSFGAKKYRCSIENLYRMILGGDNLNSISNIVNVYNYISLKYLLPMGGDNLDKVDGDMMLTLATGSESFIKLNGEEVENPKENEVIYADDKEVLCRRWNWRECDKTKITTESKNIVLVIEGLEPNSDEQIQNALEELQKLVEKYCGGETKLQILNQKNNSIKI